MHWLSPFCWAERPRTAGQDFQSCGELTAGSSLSEPNQGHNELQEQVGYQILVSWGFSAPSLWLLWLSCAWARWCPGFGGFFPSLAGYGSNEYSDKYFFTWKVSDENLLAVSDSGCGNEHP